MKRTKINLQKLSLEAQTHSTFRMIMGVLCIFHRKRTAKIRDRLSWLL